MIRGGAWNEIESLFLKEVDAILKDGVTEAEVAKAKRQLEVALLSGLATSHALAQRMAVEVANFGRVRPLEERLAAIQAVTPDDVKRVATTYLREDKRNTVQVVPPPADETGAGS